MEKILQKENVRIYCIHCKKEIEIVWVCKMDSIIGMRYALICSKCQRLIEIYSLTDFEMKLKSQQINFVEVQVPLN